MTVTLLLILCQSFLAGCVSIGAERISHFQRVEMQERKGEKAGFTTYSYYVGDSGAIAIARDTNLLPNPAWVLYFIDKSGNRTSCQSRSDELGLGWWLNIYKYGTLVFILWEDVAENYTLLPLFVLNTKTNMCSYVGEFKVIQYFDKVVDSAPYPIEAIHIEASDTLMSFKFTEKLWLLGSDPNLVADSLTYELDLRGDSLRVAQLWSRDTLR